METDLGKEILSELNKTNEVSLYTDIAVMFKIKPIEFESFIKNTVGVPLANQDIVKERWIETSFPTINAPVFEVNKVNFKITYVIKEHVITRTNEYVPYSAINTVNNITFISNNVGSSDLCLKTIQKDDDDDDIASVLMSLLSTKNIPFNYADKAMEALLCYLGKRPTRLKKWSTHEEVSLFLNDYFKRTIKTKYTMVEVLKEIQDNNQGKLL